MINAVAYELWTEKNKQPLNNRSVCGGGGGGATPPPPQNVGV